MNDIRRSLLWAVFGISVVMLWDAWQVHNGNAPLFFNQPSKTAQAPATAGDLPAAASGVKAAAMAADGSSLEAKPATQERTLIQSDVLDLVFDSAGGNLVEAKLLKYAQNLGGHNGKDFQPLTLLQQSAAHRVARVPTGKDRCRVKRSAEQMRRLPGKRRARSYRLQAIEPATAAAGVAVQGGQPTARMADVAGQAAQSAAQLAAQHQATADPGRQGHEQQVTGLPVARHKLAPGRRLGVIEQNCWAVPGLRQGISQPIAVPK